MNDDSNDPKTEEDIRFWQTFIERCRRQPRRISRRVLERQRETLAANLSIDQDYSSSRAVDFQPTPEQRPARPSHILNRLAAAALASAVALSAAAALLLPPMFAAAEPDPWRPTGGKHGRELAEAFPEFEALVHRIDPASMAETKPDKIVETIPDPNYAGFEIVAESKLFDMSRWRPFLEQDRHSKRISPVYMTRVQKLRRIPGHPANRTIRYKFWTEGFAVDPQRTGPRDVVREGTRLDPRAHRLCRVWELAVDVSDRLEGEFFELRTGAIFWNGHPADQGDQWAATAVGLPTVRQADFGVLLPAGKQIDTWSLWKYRSGVTERQPENRIKSGRLPRQEEGMFYWPIARVENGHTYELQWTW